MKEEFNKKSETYKAFLAIPMFFMFVGVSVLFLKSYEMPIEFGNKVAQNQDTTEIVKMQMAASIQSEFEKMEEKAQIKENNNNVQEQTKESEEEVIGLEDKPIKSLYSKTETQAMQAFAENIKSVVQNKDITAFSEFVNYPITLNSVHNGSEVTIQNKDELIAYGANKLFTKNFVDNVCKEDIFISWRGAMLGNGPNLFFDNINQKGLKIYAINAD